MMSSLYAAAFAGMYSETAMNVILPSVGADFHVSTALTQWLVVGYMLIIGLVFAIFVDFIETLPRQNPHFRFFRRVCCGCNY
ncbi:hypothetical protein HMPREF3214_00412 [Alloscardovia omnicolens]|nr:hypothetical protein HMPREF3214_00412 [Alloscardovia omnicolens]